MEDVDVAIEAVEAGAAVVLRWFGNALERVDKGGGDFATTADLESEHAILTVLRNRRPDDGLIGEETGRSGRNDTQRTWLVDPLCGTFNYAVMTRLVAVNVALSERGGPGVAAVADPFEGAVFWANGQRALRRANGLDTPLVPSSKSRLVDLNLSAPSEGTSSFTTAQLASSREFWAHFHPRVVSSSIALAWVATGQRAAYVSTGDVRNNVHFAAGITLCQAAGCTVTDLKGGTLGESGNGLIAAADATTHARLLEIIAGSHAKSLS